MGTHRRQTLISVPLAQGPLSAEKALFKILDVRPKSSVFLCVLLELIGRAVVLLLALLARLSGALPVFEKLVLLTWQHSSHLNQSLDRNSFDIDHKLAD